MLPSESITTFLGIWLVETRARPLSSSRLRKLIEEKVLPASVRLPTNSPYSKDQLHITREFYCESPA